MTSGRDARHAGTMPDNSAVGERDGNREEGDTAVDGERPPGRQIGFGEAVNGYLGEVQRHGGEDKPARSRRSALTMMLSASICTISRGRCAPSATRMPAS